MALISIGEDISPKFHFNETAVAVSLELQNARFGCMVECLVAIAISNTLFRREVFVKMKNFI